MFIHTRLIFRCFTGYITISWWIQKILLAISFTKVIYSSSATIFIGNPNRHATQSVYIAYDTVVTNWSSGFLASSCHYPSETDMFTHNSYLVIQSHWNFAENTVVILPRTVQMFTTIRWLEHMLRRNMQYLVEDEFRRVSFMAKAHGRIKRRHFILWFFSIAYGHENIWMCPCEEFFNVYGSNCINCSEWNKSIHHIITFTRMLTSTSHLFEW